MTEPTPKAYEAAIAKAVRCLEGAAANDGGIPAVARWLVGEVWDLAEATVRAKVAAEIRTTLRQLVDPVQLLIRVREGDADEHPLMVGLEFAARIAEGNGDTHDPNAAGG